MQQRIPAEGHVGVFLIEFSLIFLITVAGLALLGWHFAGTNFFSDRNYLFVGLAIAVILALGRLVLYNERKMGRAFF